MEIKSCNSKIKILSKPNFSLNRNNHNSQNLSLIKLPFNKLESNIKNLSNSKLTNNNDIFYQKIKELIDNSKNNPVLAQTKIEKNLGECL